MKEHSVLIRGGGAIHQEVLSYQWVWLAVLYYPLSEGVLTLYTLSTFLYVKGVCVCVFGTCVCIRFVCSYKWVYISVYTKALRRVIHMLALICQTVRCVLVPNTFYRAPCMTARLLSVIGENNLKVPWWLQRCVCIPSGTLFQIKCPAFNQSPYSGNRVLFGTQPTSPPRSVTTAAIMNLSPWCISNYCHHSIKGSCFWIEYGRRVPSHLAKLNLQP